MLFSIFCLLVFHFLFFIFHFLFHFLFPFFISILCSMLFSFFCSIFFLMWCFNNPFHVFVPCCVSMSCSMVSCALVSRAGRSGSHVPLGSCNFSVDTMLAKAGTGSTFSLEGGTGEVVVHRCNLVPQPRYISSVTRRLCLSPCAFRVVAGELSLIHI